MSKKGERNQTQQPSKAEKAYGGYLPSVQTEEEAHVGERPAQSTPVLQAEQQLPDRAGT